MDFSEIHSEDKFEDKPFSSMDSCWEGWGTVPFSFLEALWLYWEALGGTPLSFWKGSLCNWIFLTFWCFQCFSKRFYSHILGLFFRVCFPDGEFLNFSVFCHLEKLRIFKTTLFWFLFLPFLKKKSGKIHMTTFTICVQASGINYIRTVVQTITIIHLLNSFHLPKLKCH